MSRVQSADHFDLLPFVSILMCLIGCLLLVTMSIAAISIGPNAKEGWLPVRDPAFNKKTPVLVEWDGVRALIHEGASLEVADWSEPSGYLYKSKWIPAQRVRLSNELSAFIARMSTRQATHYVLFALRPTGFHNFQQFADEFRGRKIDVGYEPITQNKPVRLVGGSEPH